MENRTIAIFKSLWKTIQWNLHATDTERVVGQKGGEDSTIYEWFFFLVSSGILGQTKTSNQLVGS